MLSDVERAFDEYFAMIVEANVLALERGENDALQLVQLRRELSGKIGAVQRVVDDVSRKHSLSEASVPEMAMQRARFSDERRAVAGHQAKWNAPAMRLDRAGYERDCKALFTMHEDNHRWRKHELLPALECAVTLANNRSGLPVSGS